MMAWLISLLFLSFCLGFGLLFLGDLVLISKAFGSDSSVLFALLMQWNCCPWKVLQAGKLCRMFAGYTRCFGVGKGVDPTWGWICFGLPNPSSLFGGYRYGFHLVRFGDDWFSALFGLICFFIYCYLVHPCHVKLIEFRLSSMLAMAIMPSALIAIFLIIGRWGLAFWISWVVSIWVWLEDLQRSSYVIFSLFFSLFCIHALFFLVV